MKKTTAAAGRRSSPLETLGFVRRRPYPPPPRSKGEWGVGGGTSGAGQPRRAWQGS